MNIIEMTADQLPLEQFPHLQFQEGQVEVYKSLIEKMNKRKELIKADSEPKNDYVANENEILIIKTDMELARIHTNLIKKQMYIKDFRSSCLKTLVEMETKWNEVMAKGRLMQDKDDQLKEAMGKADAELFDKNLEAKISHYLTIKNILNPPKEEKKNHLKKA